MRRVGNPVVRANMTMASRDSFALGGRTRVHERWLIVWLVLHADLVAKRDGEAKIGWRRSTAIMQTSSL